MEETKAIQCHREWKGKIEVVSKANVADEKVLPLAYTPGVADACLAIRDNKEESFELTGRANTIAIITDGTAILGLGNIGPEAGMPVMEGKAALFKTFGNVNAYPLCIDTTDTEEIIKTVKYLKPSLGGVNLEDISAPRCFEIETRLKKELGLPVFHDDQHGTAIVTVAALINALKLVKKDIKDVTVAMSGAGAAGTAIAKFLLKLGVKDVVVCNSRGIISRGDETLAPAPKALAEITNKDNIKGTLADAMVGKDIFVGVSTAGLVSKDMVKSMAKDPIVFALANPVAEISYQDAKEAGAAVVGTGSNKNPNQINNVLVFPGLFRGALDAKATDVSFDMMLAASMALAETVKESELNAEYVIPNANNMEAHKLVAKRVYEQALREKQA